MSNVGIWTLQYRIRHLRFEITVCEVNWQFGIELCTVLWIDLLEKGRLQLKVTVVKKKNVKKRNQRHQKIWKTRAPGSVTKKRGNKRADHFNRSGRKHLGGFSSTRLRSPCNFDYFLICSSGY